MSKCSILLVVCYFVVSFSYAQTDSISVFRVNPNAKKQNGSSSIGLRNAIAININSIARGGAMLSYERMFKSPEISIYAGYGLSFIDLVGQYSFDEELEFYPQDDYSTKSMVSPGRIIDVGLKFWDATLWDDSYIGLGYSYYSNNLKRKIDSQYNIAQDGPRSYNLDYISNEIKLVLGFTNSDTKRLYVDAAGGLGLRFVNYQKLIITDDPFAAFNILTGTANREIQVDKSSEFKIKIWPFLGLKIGLRI